MSGTDHDSRSSALANLERALLEPIVEGELEMRAEEMVSAIDAMQGEMLRVGGSADSSRARGNGAGASGSLADFRDEAERLAIQLQELRMAAEQLRERADVVEPDEKQLQDEVDALVQQGREWTIDFRQHDAAMSQPRESAGEGEPAP